MALLQVFREDPGAWVVAPMHSVVHNLSSVAQAADQELRQAGQRPDKLGDCGDQLRKCFSVSLQAPGKHDMYRGPAHCVWCSPAWQHAGRGVEIPCSACLPQRSRAHGCCLL